MNKTTYTYLFGNQPNWWKIMFKAKCVAAWLILSGGTAYLIYSMCKYL